MRHPAWILRACVMAALLFVAVLGGGWKWDLVFG